MTTVLTNFLLLGKTLLGDWRDCHLRERLQISFLFGRVTMGKPNMAS